MNKKWAGRRRREASLHNTRPNGQNGGALPANLLHLQCDPPLCSRQQDASHSAAPPPMLGICESAAPQAVGAAPRTSRAEQSPLPHHRTLWGRPTCTRAAAGGPCAAHVCAVVHSR